MCLSYWLRAYQEEIFQNIVISLQWDNAKKIYRKERARTIDSVGDRWTGVHECARSFVGSHRKSNKDV